MRFLPVSCFLAIVLAACGADEPPPANHLPRAGQGAAPKLISTTPIPIRAKVEDEVGQLLAALERRASISLRYDRVRTIDGGTKQRQVFVEMLSLDTEETVAYTTEEFENAGFIVRKGLDDQNGIRLQYRKSGVEPLNVLVRSVESSPRLKDPTATASLYIRQSVD